jgi:hypothetical protein
MYQREEQDAFPHQKKQASHKYVIGWALRLLFDVCGSNEFWKDRLESQKKGLSPLLEK